MTAPSQLHRVATPARLGFGDKPGCSEQMLKSKTAMAGGTLFQSTTAMPSGPEAIPRRTVVRTISST
jgi:hypothetical protein